MDFLCRLLLSLKPLLRPVKPTIEFLTMIANTITGFWIAVSRIFSHRVLIWQFAKRDFVGRYKGSIVGVGWTLFNPLLMLAIYTLVFSVAFKARWGGPDQSKVAFAIVLFCGLIVHGFFSECLNRSPDLINRTRITLRRWFSHLRFCQL